MEVLVAGNTVYVDDAFSRTAFPDAHVQTVASDDASAALHGERGSARSWAALLDQLEQAYDFDQVVFLSSYLTPHTDSFGDLERLRRVFRACGDREVRFLYIAGPMGALSPDGRTRSGKGILGSAAEDLCRYYADERHCQAKILRTPYLYTMSQTATDPFLDRLFTQCARGRLVLEGAPDSALPVLCAEELSRLIARIFDSWTPDFETLGVADCFAHTVGDLGTELCRLFPGLDISYGSDAHFDSSSDDGTVRSRYGWFQRYDLIRDLSTAQAAWQGRRDTQSHRFRRVIDRLRSRSFAVKLVETGAAWVLFEALTRFFAGSSQLNVIDYRVVYVVLIGTMYGLDFGLAAAALACVGLAFQYFIEYGYSFQSLFYDPSNWLPFIAYFVVGSVCGYVQMRNREELALERDESELLRSRNDFLNTLYRNTLEDRRELKRQIVGRHDSFGKIFSVTRELDLMNPREIYRKCCLIMGDILENESVSIYHITGGAFARLVAASPAQASRSPRSLSLENMQSVLDGTAPGEVWVNRDLSSGLPMFSYTILRNGAPAILIFVNEASESQMTLYYQNLFKILCGLVESSLLRAFEFEDAVRDSRYIDGTAVLTEAAFIEELESEQRLKEGKMSDYLLLRVVPGGEPVAELMGCMGRSIRETDAAGLIDGDTLYLLMRQATLADAPAVLSNLSARSISAEVVDYEDAIALVQGHSSGERGAR